MSKKGCLGITFLDSFVSIVKLVTMNSWYYRKYIVFLFCCVLFRFCAAIFCGDESLYRCFDEEDDH
jgi:hypothetical protein